MTINQAGLNLIKMFEGLRLKAYQDPVGIWTIGYGSTGEHVSPGLVIDEHKALELLRQDVSRFEKGVMALLKRKPGENQFSAMVCFAYNVGLGNFKKSTLLNCFNKGNFKDAGQEFLRWDKAQGRVLPGLIRRRKAERDLFLKDS